MNIHILKKLFSSIMIIVLILGTVITMNVYAEESYTITINKKENDNVEHTYYAYQIFKGDLYEEHEDSKILSNIDWGNGIDQTKTSDLIQALKADTTLAESFAACDTPRQIAVVLEGFGDDSEKLKAFAEVVSQYLSDTATATSIDAGENYTITTNAPGYYFIKDKDGSLDDEYSAYTRYMLKVVSSITVDPKSEKPTVDKSLSETEDVDVSDYAINEEFYYYLTANLPINKEFSEYEKYKLIFEDKMDNGITYDGIESIVVKAHSSDSSAVEDFTLEETDYEKEGTVGGAGQVLKITITDLVSILTEHGADISKGVDVIVKYKAHLNENAIASSTKEDAENKPNKNTVKLQYSNNPNKGEEESVGTTVEDTNYVFTYEVFNTKYSDLAEKGNELAGAEFKLYAGAKAEGDEIKLKWDEIMHVYYPIRDSESEGDKLISQEDGTFNIKGLDVGTYTLKEVVTPPGYNTCEDFTFTIEATVKTEAELAKVEFPESKKMEYQIVNVHGSKLPSTGSITLIIICGTAAVLGIGGLILSRNKKEE